MNINNSITQYTNQANNIVTTGTQKLTGDTVSSLKEGQVFEGSINSIDDQGRVVIGMSNGSTLNARLSTGISITQGQSLFFQVKSNDGAMVQIRPVSLNIEQNPTLLKALESANIMATEKTVSMVNHMMQESMPINSESLSAMNRVMLSNPSINPETIVLMTKYDLPVSVDNANMFEAYSTDSAQIMSNVDKISDDLAMILKDDSISIDNKISFVNEINSIFNEKSTAVSIVANEPTVLNQQEIVAENRPLAETMPASTEVEFKAFVGANNELEKAVIVQENENTGSNILSASMNTKEISSLQNILQTFGDFSKVNEKLFTAEGAIKPNITANELLSAVNTYLSENPDVAKKSVKDLFSNDGFKGLINNVMKNSFSIKPEEITKPGSISELFERVLKQTESLEAAASKTQSKIAEALKQTTSELKSNINFMNSANEMYNFVQIPLKMFEQNSQSMLYVRQNKAKAYENGEEITAYLHFDMKYLGSTDIFIRLKQRDVSCDWTLADESSIKLIEDNIDILNSRLAAKGYNCNMTVSAGTKQADFVQDFLKGSPTVGDGIVHRYSFDMRA